MRYALLSALLTLSTAAIAGAQENLCPVDAPVADTSRPPDLVIRASASAESVRFEAQPRVEVRLTGCAVLDTVRVLERRNLPDPVQPGVTYRNVYIATEILGHLNVECLLEGLGGAGGAQPEIAGPDAANGGVSANGDGTPAAAQVAGCNAESRRAADREASPALPAQAPTPAAVPDGSNPQASPPTRTMPAGAAVPPGNAREQSARTTTEESRPARAESGPLPPARKSAAPSA